MGETFAGTIGEALDRHIKASPDTDIPVIIYFSKKFNLSPLEQRMRDFFFQPGTRKPTAGQRLQRRELRRRLRSEYIQALRFDAKQSQRDLRATLTAAGRPVKRDLWLLNALAVELPAGSLAGIAALPGVDKIELDREIRLTALPATGGAVPTWNLERVGAPDVWQLGVTGAGVTVATMDSGVDGEHPDLAANWRGGANSWFDAYGQYSQPHDGNGHGTQTMGLIVGGTASGSAIGVAPDAQWIAAKIFRDDMTATLSAIHAGFQWMLDPDGNAATDDAPDVVNNSWGLPYGTVPDQCDTEFHADIDALSAAGIAVVFAAGNDGPAANTLLSPADYDAVISVGAMDAFYNVPSFSSRGPSNCSRSGVFPELSAPGVDIYTSDLSFGLGLALDPYEPGAQGTSFAAPHVSGIIALLKSDQPAMSSAEIRSSLISTAIDYGEPGPDDAFGYGLVDAYRALLEARCAGGVQDTDNDGWYDACDNCTQVPNTQTDADQDGYGNACDADLDNSGFVNSLDIIQFINAVETQDLEADFNDDGVVNTLDTIGFINMFATSPGPSGAVN